MPVISDDIKKRLLFLRNLKRKLSYTSNLMSENNKRIKALEFKLALESYDEDRLLKNIKLYELSIKNKQNLLDAEEKSSGFLEKMRESFTEKYGKDYIAPKHSVSEFDIEKINESISFYEDLIVNAF